MTKNDLKLLRETGMINNFKYTYLMGLFNQITAIKNLINMEAEKYEYTLKELKEKEKEANEQES